MLYYVAVIFMKSRRSNGHTKVSGKVKEIAEAQLIGFYQKIEASGKFPMVPQIAELEDLLCVCGCGSRVTNSKVVCVNCRRLLSSSCKKSKDGICALCVVPSLKPVSGSGCALTGTASSGDASTGQLPGIKLDGNEYDDEFSTTADESSSSAKSSVIAAVERRMQRKIDNVATNILTIFQQSAQKMEESHRMLLECIQSTHVWFCFILTITIIILLFRDQGLIVLLSPFTAAQQLIKTAVLMMAR